MGSLGPDCEYIAVADPIGDVSLEGKRIVGLPLAAHVEGVSAAHVEDDQVERGVFQALLPYLSQGGLDDGVGLGGSASLRDEIG